MIGVLADSAERDVVNEFFELFKTPWQFYDGLLEPEILVCTGDRCDNRSAKLVIIYGSGPNVADEQRGFEPLSRYSDVSLSYQGQRIPIYGKCVTFRNGNASILRHQITTEPAAARTVSSHQTIVRIGYDLFREVRFLLNCGQPVTNAGIPTLELHIAILRDLIIRSSIPLVEIPPIPARHNFIVCLSHDVDQPAIRNHKFDRTLWGFLYRALIGSWVNFCKGGRSLKFVATNWLAALSLPFVHLGLVRDFWSQLTHYVEIEKDAPSTFFIISKKGDAGRTHNGTASALRAARYSLQDIRHQIDSLIGADREIGLHGIDAWLDANEGRSELDAIRRVTGNREVGVRMHWLFFTEDSPAKLEKAGFSYDSTVGYNETVGYRAGTTQVFRPPTVQHLSELPLHVMDTALFLPSRMGLSLQEGGEIITKLLADFDRFGGALTVNWHDRSIAPERLWGEIYRDLLEECKNRHVWFATASNTVSWFQKRRSVTFQRATDMDGQTRLKVSATQRSDELPGLRLRIHKSEAEFIDTIFDNSAEAEFSFPKSQPSMLRSS